MFRYDDLGWASSKEVSRRLNPHLLSLTSIPDEIQLVEVDAAMLLLKARRFDLIAKYIYAKHRELAVQCGWSARLYEEHIRVFNNHIEGDGSGKVGKDAFFKSYHEVLESIKRKGFDADESLIPISRDGVVIDGSHRVAACAIRGITAVSVILDDHPNFDYRFFRDRGLDTNWCDAIALEYCGLNQNAHIVVVYPSAVGKDELLEEILENDGSIFYRKDVRLNDRGSVNLIRQIYSKEEWLGSWGNGFSGAQEKARNCFRSNNPLRVFAYETSDLDTARRVKQKIRDLYQIGNHSVHINDSQHETTNLAKIFFNDNSVHFLNNARQKNFSNFFRLFSTYRDWISGASLSKDSFCVDGSSVMSVYGIREAADLDFLHFGHDHITGPVPLINCHNSEAHHHTVARDEIIFDPNNHFFYEGVKFASLDVVRKMKENRAEGKDRHDIALTRVFLMGNSIRFNSLQVYSRVAKNIFTRVRALAYYPPRFARRVWKFGLRAAMSAFDRLRPFERTLNYEGFRVFYSRGTSIVERFKKEGNFEEESANRIALELEGVQSPSIMDVGANIGLVSLNILSKVRDASIFAFEPGPHQFKLFQKTIAANDLEEIIALKQIALGDHNGKERFTVHHTMHASGDGFFDTGRAGRSKSIEVDVCTIDSWWIESGRPMIHLIKIDTEGAELYGLTGRRGNDHSLQTEDFFGNQRH